MPNRITSDWNGNTVADRKAAPNRPKYSMRCSMGDVGGRAVGRAQHPLLHVLEGAEIATRGELYGNRRGSAVAPEPAVIAIKGGNELALVAGYATALGIGDLGRAAVAMGVVVHRAVFHRPGIG